MTKERRIERNGRIWILSKVPRAEAEERDFEFWYEGLTPVERVAAVADALLSSLKAQGIDEIPRLRRVHRRVERERRQVPDSGSARGGVPRSSPGDEGPGPPAGS